MAADVDEDLVDARNALVQRNRELAESRGARLAAQLLHDLDEDRHSFDDMDRYRFACCGARTWQGHHSLCPEGRA